MRIKLSTDEKTVHVQVSGWWDQITDHLTPAEAFRYAGEIRALGEYILAKENQEVRKNLQQKAEEED